MGKCSFSSRVTEKYPWAVAVPGNIYVARCKLDNKVINIKSGFQKLHQHSVSDVHKVFQMHRKPAFPHL